MTRKRINVRRTIKEICLVDQGALRLGMLSGRIQALIYPPPVSPREYQDAVAFLRGVDQAFRVHPDHSRFFYEEYAHIADRFLAIRPRYLRPNGLGPPWPLGRLISKEQARINLAAMHHRFARYGVPHVTRHEYMRAIFVGACYDMHWRIAKLQRHCGYAGGGGEDN